MTGGFPIWWHWLHSADTSALRRARGGVAK
jgi:hypothetical protein